MRAILPPQQEVVGSSPAAPILSLVVLGKGCPSMGFSFRRCRQAYFGVPIC